MKKTVKIASVIAGVGVGVFLGLTLISSPDQPSTQAVAPSHPDVTKEVAEIQGLSIVPQVQKALTHIAAIEDLSNANHIELTEIPAPPFAEDARAARFAEMLKEAGLEDVVIDEVGNVIGRRKGTVGDRTIAIAAHLDTVFPEGTDVTVRYEGNRLYAPGIGDNTRGLVVVLAVLRALEATDIETEADVLFVGNVGEEGLGDLRGVKHLFREGAAKIDAYIAVDGGEASRLIYGGVGSHRYRVTYNGPGGHSWGAFGLANPHHALGRAIAAFDKTAPAVTTKGEKTSYSIGRIGGGTSINSIPFSSWMEVDMRSGSQVKLDEIDAVFQKAMQKALKDENDGRAHGPELSVDVKRVGKRPAGVGSTEAPLVKRMMASMKHYGIEPKLRISSTDSNIPISLGIPAITISRGGIGGGAHSPDEWWENTDGPVASQIGFLTVLAQAGMAK